IRSPACVISKRCSRWRTSARAWANIFGSGDSDWLRQPRAPAPSEDIEARVRDYVLGLAPKVPGVGVGERLSIVWPGAHSSSGYLSEHTCDPLALLAALLPDRMLSLVMTEVERMANDPLPLAQRAPRVAAPERELDELHRVEEVLVAAEIAAGQGRGEGFARRLINEDAARIPPAPPAG